MNVILLTVLLTLLGASLVVLLVWLSVVVYKSIKYKKRIDNLNESLSSNINQLYNCIDEKNKELATTINQLYNYIDEKNKETKNNIDSVLRGFNIDSRFDKLHNLLKDKEKSKKKKE
jgi:predicted PurR-regulated permease PerM